MHACKTREGRERKAKGKEEEVREGKRERNGREEKIKGTQKKEKEGEEEERRREQGEEKTAEVVGREEES